MPPDDEVELVRRAVAGDELARTRLAPTLAAIPRIVQALQRASGRFVAPHDRDDVIQDCSALVWRKLPDFAGRSRLTTWLYRVVALELKNALRRVAKRRREIPADAAGAPPAVATRADDPQRILVPLALEECLARLEATPMRIIRMRHWEEQTFDQIAAALGDNPSHVKFLYYRALARLQALLGDDFEARA
ncbi:MAG: sigma-70 family RNA polymerase sigma factor [Planctomycetes bacterium]|nr:sigma-70 family RNA polymerase sigma factor [Planctomycetota bacterium]